MTRSTEHTEILVVGAGPAGYATALRAAHHDASVRLVDGDGIGGTCLNHGCIPSKALISAADRVHRIGTADDQGIYADPYVSFPELVEWTDGVVERLSAGIVSLCQGAGVEITPGRAELVDDRTADVETPEESVRCTFDRAVIATGSRPMTLDGFDTRDDPILNSKQALSLSELPDSLVVVGGGYIGMELGTMFHKLGCEVTVLEMCDRLLPEYGTDVAEAVERRAESLGMTVSCNSVAQTWEEVGDEVVVRARKHDETTREYACDAVLVAIGREPVTDTISREAVGIETDDEGFIETGPRGETACDGVYAIGDVAGPPMLAHKAIREGLVVAAALAGDERIDPDPVVPHVVFTDPEVATVGLTEAEATADGRDVEVGTFPLSANGRAASMGSRRGFVRLVRAAGTSETLGATIVGPEASELVAEATLAVQHDLPVEAIADAVHPHPTLSEGLAESAEILTASGIHWQDTGEE